MTNMQANDNDDKQILYPPMEDNEAFFQSQQQIRDNFDALRKRRGDNAQLAVETALLVNDQVKRMKACIAELEQLLEQPPLDGETVPPADDKVRFPDLPRVVVVQDDSEVARVCASPPPPNDPPMTTTTSSKSDD